MTSAYNNRPRKLEAAYPLGLRERRFFDAEGRRIGYNPLLSRDDIARCMAYAERYRDHGPEAFTPEKLADLRTLYARMYERP